MTCLRLLLILLPGLLLQGRLKASVPMPGPDTLVEGVDVASVVVDGRELFRVRGVSIYKASVRAEEISNRIKKLAADPDFTVTQLHIESGAEEELIMGGTTVILRVQNLDAELSGIERQMATELMQHRITEAVEQYRHERNSRVVMIRGAIALAMTLSLGILLWLLRKLHTIGCRFIHSRILTKIEKGVQIQSFEVVQRQHIWMLYRGLMDVIRIGGTGMVIYLYLENVLRLFPWTRGAGEVLLELLISPLRTLWTDFVGYIPDFIFLVVLFFLVRYTLRVIRLFFLNLEEGRIRFRDFDPEWAQPTFRLLRTFIVLLSLVVAYPYIPGSDSSAFKGLSVFMGVVLSLGSSSLIGNVIAGYTMTYRKAFRVGDRIKVGEHLGEVLEIRMLITRLRSPKNEEIIIPNSEILSREVINYSTLADTRGLVVHTLVGIGYETPWRQVEAMLLEAAEKTEGALREPAPFVLQKLLGDFAVTYEINVYCGDATRSYLTYSSLLRNILDVFNHYGVQIMTPNYERDPEVPKIVPEEDWFTAPAKKEILP